MIGQQITGEDGNPLPQYQKLTPSEYQPPKQVKELFAKVQHDYQVAWALQHRTFDEFDGYSLLNRARKDQETFAAYVGCEFVPSQKRWRWRGRKNTARNKLISLCSRALAGMLYPYVYAKNDQNEEDKMTARVMRILIEDHLRKAKYEVKFLYMALSALVNPAVFVQVEYVEAMQRIKQQMKDGTAKILEVVDEILSGLQLNILPIDEIMLCDYFSGTGNIQILPVILRIRRIPYDYARAIYAGKYFDKNGRDLFDYVVAGKTRIFLSGQDNETLFDVEWTEADRNYVQVITAKYRPEDLEVDFVGGVGMLNEDDCYNTNPFKHRRMTFCETDNGQEWLSIPLYDIAMSGFEPIDPAGRFAFYKSGAFKEYWDALGEDKMHQLAFDATQLDVFKPVFLSGAAAFDSTVMRPGASVGMPLGASVTPYALGPNLAAALRMMQSERTDQEDSTKSTPVPTDVQPNVTATQTAAAVQQAKMFFSVFSLMIADLVNQIGGLAMDCAVQYSTVGELDASIPGALGMKFKTFLAQGKDKGKNVTNKIIFSDKRIGKKYTKAQIDKTEWDMYNKSGATPQERYYSDQRIYEVNPYQFARTSYTMFVDADKIAMKSMGADKMEKRESFEMMSDPRVAPFTDRQAVATDFVIEEYGGDDPDKYKAKTPPSDEMLNSIFGGGTQGADGGAQGAVKSPAGMVGPAAKPQLK
ncbi:MAG: hypothetical protein V4438_04185 [Patescibacteria group bacterium]